MAGFLTDAGFAVFINVIQVIAGCLPAVFIQRHIAAKIPDNKKLDIVLIAFAAILGTVLPLGVFGVIPIIAALVFAGIKIHHIIPLFVSNALFNLSVPFTELSFTWSASRERVITAFAAGVLAGLIVKAAGYKEESLFRMHSLTSYTAGEGSRGHSFFLTVDKNIKAAAGFIVAGSLVNVFVVREGIIDLSWAVQIMYTLLSGHNYMNPFVFLAVKIASVLLDFVRLFAMLAIFKLRAIAGYYVFFSGIAVVLVFTSLFIY